MSDWLIIVLALALLGGIWLLANRMEAATVHKHALLGEEIQRIRNISGPKFVFPSEFVVRVSYSGLTCLPADLDTAALTDITRLGQRWKVYFDENTGKSHDGAKYWDSLLKVIGGITNA